MEIKLEQSLSGGKKDDNKRDSETGSHSKIAINSADTETKNKALANMADELLAHTDAILEANKQDVEAAKGKISDVMIDRLMLDAGRIEGMAKGIRELICLEDPGRESNKNGRASKRNHY